RDAGRREGADGVEPRRRRPAEPRADTAVELADGRHLRADGGTQRLVEQRREVVAPEEQRGHRMVVSGARRHEHDDPLEAEVREAVEGDLERLAARQETALERADLEGAA